MRSHSSSATSVAVRGDSFQSTFITSHSASEICGILAMKSSLLPTTVIKLDYNCKHVKGWIQNVYRRAFSSPLARRAVGWERRVKAWRCGMLFRVLDGAES